jgi:hypothetical protein
MHTKINTTKEKNLLKEPKNRCSELLGFWTLPLSGILGTTKHDFSETVSVSVLRCGGEDTYSVGSLRHSYSQITGQPLSDSHSYLIT